jgi:uncharacterized protein (TIGR02270 family)
MPEHPPSPWTDSPVTKAFREVPTVLLQHLADAAALRAQRGVAVAAPHVELRRLARLDERLYAHLDGLAVAGDAGWRLAQEALETPGVGQIFTLAVLAIERHDRAQLDRLLSLVGVVPDAERALASAVGWVSGSSLRGLTAPLLASPKPLERWIGIVACALHRVDPGPALAAAIHDGDARLAERALRAAGELGRVDLLDDGLARIGDDAAALRRAALASAVLLGDRRRALPALTELAVGRDPAAPDALLRLALLAAEPAAARDLVRQLIARGAPCRTAIRATGWAGDLRAVPWLIQQMDDKVTARVAGEAFSLLTGADLALLDLERKPPTEAPTEAPGAPTDRPDDDRVALDEDESLPWPDSARVQAWWAQQAGRSPGAPRVFMGAEPGEAHCRQVLCTGGQRQRAAAALWLTLMKPGTPLFNTAAPAPRQQRLLGLPQRVT